MQPLTIQAPTVLSKKRFSPISSALFAIAMVAICDVGGDARAQTDANSSPRSVSIDGIGFTLPESLQIEKVAGNDMTIWPIVATWDSDGSLVVAESVWNRQKVQEQLVSRPHRIVRLRDTDLDGRFDQRVIIAKDLSFPEGVLCLGNEILVTAPPQIWKLSDTDNDGFFETHDVWFDGKTLTGCANDLHGPWLGHDGWIYWSKSAFAEQTNTVRSGDVLTSKASHLFRRHPNGGAIESVMTGGMDNLVDIAISPEGERFFCSTFLHHPRSGFRDGIGHAVYGSVFGKPHDVLNNHLKTGPLMAPIAELGPAAPAGLICLQHDAPILSSLSSSPSRVSRTAAPATTASPNSVLLCAQFNLQKVSMHELRPSGASFTTTSADLLSADKIDFHPVDVLQDDDGSLLVIDTGGWYDLCCPSSGTDQRVAQGGIYRISSNATRSLGKVAEPSKASTLKEYVAAVGSSHPANSRRATHWLEGHAEDAINAIDSVLHDPTARAENQTALLWLLTRMHTRDVQSSRVERLVVECLKHSSVSLQQTSLQIVSLNLWPSAKPHVATLLNSQSPAVKRLAAECMGRYRDSSDVDLLMRATKGCSTDRALEHAILYALLEIKDTNRLATFLSSEDADARYAALFCLNELQSNEHLTADVVAAALSDPNDRVRKIAIDVMAKNSSWSEESTGLLTKLWSSGEPSALADLEKLLVAWAGQSRCDAQVGMWLADAVKQTPLQRALLLNVIGKQNNRSLPNDWFAPLGKWIEAADREQLIAISAALKNMRWNADGSATFVQTLVNRTVKSMPTDLELGLAIAGSLPKATSGLPIAIQSRIIDACHSENTGIQQLAFTALSKVRIDSVAAEALIGLLPSVTPAHLPMAIECLLQSRNASLDQQLLATLTKTPATKTLSESMVMGWLKDRTAETQSQWKTLFEGVNRPPENVHAEIERWIAKLPAGDKTQGFHVFRGAKAACSGCHQVGYVGGNIGPELSRIGQTRTRRDLVEAILFPSVRLAQSYQSTKVLTEDGTVLNGLIAKETPMHLELILSADKRITVAIDEIDKRELSDISVMPAGLEQQLSLQELADLLAFLESAK